MVVEYVAQLEQLGAFAACRTPSHVPCFPASLPLPLSHKMCTVKCSTHLFSWEKRDEHTDRQILFSVTLADRFSTLTEGRFTGLYKNDDILFVSCDTTAYKNSEKLHKDSGMMGNQYSKTENKTPVNIL